MGTTTTSVVRSLVRVLASAALVIAIAPAAEAAPFTLQYDVTFTRLCATLGNTCSDVNLGGFVLSLTGDDTIDSYSNSSESTEANFGPVSLVIDASALGFFENPFGHASGIATNLSSVYDVDTGDLQWSGASARNHFIASGGPGFATYVTHSFLQGESPKTPGDGVLDSLTSADVVRLFSEPNFVFQYSVAAWTRACGSCKEIYDPRSFSATGTVTLRDTMPVPEPATLSLLGLGLAAAAAHRARKR